MADFADIRTGLSKSERLERELHLKQLQINKLLNITQAINNNVKAKGLFEMYESFLSWEMRVKKMALFLRQTDNSWCCSASLGLDSSLVTHNIQERLSDFTKLENIDEEEDPLISEFDVVIPVHHKDQPLAYVFIGGFGEDEDLYNKVQLITAVTNIIAVAIENKRLFKRQLEQQRIQKELELAGDMQRMLIPDTFPKDKGYELASIYKPKLGVGGDYFDYIEPEKGRFTFCIGDISGKGVAAALLMANFQATFHSLVEQGSDLDVLIKALNEAVLRITNGDRFITFFIAEYDLRTQTLRYINAGHNPPFLIMNGEVQLLDKGCVFLGSFKEMPSCEIGEINVSNEALILTYTDGLTDVRNEEGDFLDETFGHRFMIDNYRLNAEAFNEELMQAINNFKGNTGFPDDLTVLTCKIY